MTYKNFSGHDHAAIRRIADISGYDTACIQPGHDAHKWRVRLTQNGVHSYLPDARGVPATQLKAWLAGADFVIMTSRIVTQPHTQKA